MTIAPLFASACDLAERMPAMVSEFLDLENKIGRRFREDSVTDIILASLLKMGGKNATVLVPSESRTGGDFDILLINPSRSEAVQYRIQAKRLAPHKINWKWGSYREIDHPHGTGAQSSELVRSSSHESITTIPLYAFYNPESVCIASGGLVSGIEMADGIEIRSIVKSIVNAKQLQKRPRLKRVENLLHLFFPLSTLLCEPSVPNPESTIITPRYSLNAVEAAIASRREAGARIIGQRSSTFSSADSEPAVRLAETPQRLVYTERGYPAVIQDALQRLSSGSRIRRARVKRPKIILIDRSE
jgi:hypothetical protein